MAVDFFRLLDIRNRRAFGQIGRNGLTYRSRLKDTTLTLEKSLRGVLPSNYQSSITGPNYTIALRAYAIEFARIRLAIEDLEGDTYIDTPAYCGDRADLAYQKIGSMLALNKDLPLSLFSSQEFCQFMLSLVEIFFGGSTPANIVKGIESFVGEEGGVTLSENFQDAKNPNSAFDISDQFGFRIDFELTETISQNFQEIGVKLDFLLKLIKPAHTLYILRFIFTDLIEFIKNADDSVKTESLWDHAYDDLRKYCEGVEGRDRLGTNTSIAITEDLTGVGGSTLVTSKGPISQRLDPAVARVADVSVTVDGVAVAVSEVKGSQRIIVLAVPVLTTETVVVSYYYWKNTRFQMRLNQPGRVLGGSGRGAFPIQWVINTVHAKNPQQVNWSYEGFESAYTAALNDPTRLRLNQPTHKISDSAGNIYPHKHVLNWANYVRSPDQTGGFEHLLNEGTPLVEKKIAANAIFEWETGTTTSDQEGWGDQIWGASAWGGVPSEDTTSTEASRWVTVTPAQHFASPLHTESVTEGDTGLIQVACENLESLSIDEGLTETYNFPVIPYCDNSGLFIFNVSVLNGTDLLNNFEGVDGCQLTQELHDTPLPETMDIPTIVTDALLSSLEVEGEISRGESYSTVGMFIFNTSVLNGTDVLWNNEILGHWNDEGDITVILGGTTYHIPSNERDLTAGPP